MRYNYRKIRSKRHLAFVLLDFFASAPKRSATVKNASNESTCLYREHKTSNDEVCCAVGYLIPDSLYSYGMEGKPARDLIPPKPDLDPKSAHFHEFLMRYELTLRAAQRIHDDHTNWDKWGFKPLSMLDALRWLSIDTDPFTPKEETKLLNKLDKNRALREEAWTNAPATI